MTRYTMIITIPNKHWKKIWSDNYPDIASILGEYFFVLSDTYGLNRKSIEVINNELLEKLKPGDTLEFVFPDKRRNNG